MKKTKGSIFFEIAFFLMLVASVIYGGFISVSRNAHRELEKTLRRRFLYDGEIFWKS